MKKKIITNGFGGVGTFFIGLVFFVALLFILVWRNESIKQLSRRSTTLSRQFDSVSSECAALEVAISELSTSERLSNYAIDTLGMALPTTDQVISVYRESSGRLVDMSTPSFWSRFKGLLFKEKTNGSL